MNAGAPGRLSRGRKPSLSSILKALRRVEESGQAGETLAHPSLPYEASSQRPSWKPRGWFPGRGWVYLLTLVMVLAGAGAAYFWWGADGTMPPTASMPNEVRAQLPPRPPESAAPPVSVPARTVQPKPAPPSAPPLETASSPVQATPPSRSESPVQAPPPTSRVRPREGPSSPPAEARPSPARSIASSAERSDKGRTPTPRTVEDNLSRIDESKLKVMAIAWATDPSRRLAVVNGHIVKEGESVEGFSVTQIRKDDIIVNDGGRSWRVELTLKSQP